MSLIECPECGKRISEFAPSCMDCGCPMSIIKDIINKNNLKGKEVVVREIKQEKQETKTNIKQQKIKEQTAEEQKRMNIEKEHKKYLEGLRVEQFDIITVDKLKNSHNKRTFRVDTKRNYGHDLLIGLKYLDIFEDIRKEKWRIIDIKKNNPYEGLESILPKRI